MPGEPRDFNIAESMPIEKPNFTVRNTEMMRAVLSTIKRNIRDGATTLDLGCGRGWIERLMLNWAKNQYITCVDQDEDELARVRRIKKNYEQDQSLSQGLSFMQKPGNQIEIIKADLNLFAHNNDMQDLDLILLNAVLHEINEPENKEQYLINLLNKFKAMTRVGGKVIIGDFYFANDVTAAQIRAYQDFQLRTAHHVDHINSYVNPAELQSLIADKSKMQGLRLDFSNSIRATDEINRKYYIMEITHEAA